MARKKRSTGGKINVMNGEGSPILEAAKKTSSSGFKRGGAIQGEKSEPRMDKRARGGRAIASRGGAPYSSAGTGSGHAGKSDAGHESEG